MGKEFLDSRNSSVFTRHFSGMAAMDRSTSLLVTSIITLLVVIPTVAAQNNCSDVSLLATENSQYITSPRYPYHYLSDTDCQWNITATSSSQVVVLKVLDLYIEGTLPSCDYADSVSIYDGFQSISSLIQTLCGHGQNLQFTSTGSYMTVVFHSDGSVNYRGFKFEYTSMNKSAQLTDNNLTASASSSNFTSPNYPASYPSNIEKKWRITAATPSQVVVLRVLDFNLEGYSPICNYDYVTIYDGDNRDLSVLQNLCGTPSVTHITSTGPSMTVVFHSDYSNNYRGFKFGYTSIEKPVTCSSSSLTASSTVKYLTSPNYPGPYTSYMDCQWYITAPSYSSSTIVLEITRLNLNGNQPDCTSDYVRIYDGRGTYSRQIKVLCGDMESGTFESTGSHMTVVFHSDGANSNYTEFKFTYRSKETMHSGWDNADTELLAPVPEYNGINTDTKYEVPVYTSDTSSYFNFRLLRIGFGLGGGLLSIICAATACRKRRQRLLLHRASAQVVNHPSASVVGTDENSRTETPIYVRMDGPYDTTDPPAYSSLNDDVPAYSACAPGYSYNDPSHYDFSDQSGFAVAQDSVPLLNDQKAERSLTTEDNVAYSDENVRNHVTS